jgi:hypothetical protein
MASEIGNIFLALYKENPIDARFLQHLWDFSLAEKEGFKHKVLRGIPTMSISAPVLFSSVIACRLADILFMLFNKSTIPQEYADQILKKRIRCDIIEKTHTIYEAKSTQLEDSS